MAETPKITSSACVGVARQYAAELINYLQTRPQEIKPDACIGHCAEMVKWFEALKTAQAEEAMAAKAPPAANGNPAEGARPN